MNINIKLPDVLQEKIENEISSRMKDKINEILSTDEGLDKMIKETIRGQVKTCALKILQGNDLRSRISQKIYPIIYQTLGIEVRREDADIQS